MPVGAIDGKRAVSTENGVCRYATNGLFSCRYLKYVGSVICGSVHR